MSNNAKDKKPNAAAPGQPPAPKAEAIEQAVAEELPFELQMLEFWDKNKKLVIGGVCAVFIGFSVYSLVTWKIEDLREKQGLALSAAKDAAGFERVAKEYRGENVGGYALLMLADDLYQSGKYEDSAKTYQRFLDEYPKHPLSGAALFGKGAARESLNDIQGALNAYQAVLTMFPTDIHVPDTRMAIGRCEESRGDTIKARQAYEDVIANFPNTPWAMQAAARLTVLDREARAKGLTPPPPRLPTAGPTPTLPGGISLMPSTPVAPVAPPAATPAPKPVSPAK
ncbi:MAG: tetratricopeptide repeat protein [Verrucomicrobia bacterium]|nr:tetratricopeptide repeat protein [Verrucomicrobiota bacterium]